NCWNCSERSRKEWPWHPSRCWAVKGTERPRATVQGRWPLRTAPRRSRIVRKVKEEGGNGCSLFLQALRSSQRWSSHPARKAHAALGFSLGEAGPAARHVSGRPGRGCPANAASSAIPHKAASKRRTCRAVIGPPAERDTQTRRQESPLNAPGGP